MSWQRLLRSKSSNFINIIIVFLVICSLYLIYFDYRFRSVKKDCIRRTKTVTVFRHKLTTYEQLEPKNRDNFSDIENYLFFVRNSSYRTPYDQIIFKDEEFSTNPTLGEISGRLKKYKLHMKNLTNLEKFHLHSISKNQTYRENDPIIPLVLHDLATLPILNMKVKSGGTQLKLKFIFPNKIRAIFKPMRFPRDRKILENHFYFTDFERHHSEIAGFHLDNALGFRRTMPVVGRKVNITRDIRNFANEELEDTFFTSFSNRTCFFSNCMYHCNKYHPVCADNDGMLEGSLAAYLPTFKQGRIKEYRSPWRRSYSAHHRADWEKDEDYCIGVKNTTEWKNGRQLLDFVDLGVFDFIMGNSDRHSFGIFRQFGNTSAPIIYDNGRGFGDPFIEDYTIPIALLQCCIIRESTVLNLLRLHNGPRRLSTIMRESLSKDPLAPVLWEPYYEAMDRRVELLLKEIRKCIENGGKRSNPSVTLTTGSY